METEGTNSVKLFDYGKSFIIGSGHPTNNPRFMIEAICSITDDDGTETYYQAAPCKGEHTFADDKLFEENSFDFLPIIHKDQILIFRNWKFFNQTERVEYKKAYDSRLIWGEKLYDIKWVEPKELLDTSSKVISAVNRGLPIMCRIVLKQNNKTAIIDFPVKTANTLNGKYQIDTGPILFPNLLGVYPCKIFTFNLAYVAFNSFDFVEFILEELTQLFGVYEVARYVRTVKIDKPLMYLYSL